MDMAKTAAEPLLRLEQVSKIYGSKQVLNGISLILYRGESLILRGGNGSGKSTLLKLIAGLIPASTGRAAGAASGLRIGFAPDRLPKLRMTSEEYLMHMGRIAGMAKASAAERIQELHTLLELPAGSRSMLIHYSKGMLQKVNLMQACLAEPDLLLLDEPFSGLDVNASDKLLALLHGLRAKGTAVVTSLHDPLPSWESASTTYRLHEGRLVPEESGRSGEPHTESAFYELDGLLPEFSRLVLAGHFPDTAWTAAGQAVRCRIPASDCQAFLHEFWQAEGTVLSLNRKEESR
ncbi:ATP-binding cassette domain-containing protein [Saccharibacillus qingshengii]|uniref:ATP-binding cassette domain-containing protein n=1 Tax=Saccharibacillus qingshengii TaxID=1763540 RepID=UPI001555F7B2|nr:ABC transporter ATP-binding protein [Saccharibacillus qingshengii]